MVYPKTGIAHDYLPEESYSGELKSAANDPQSKLCKTNTGGELAEMCSAGIGQWEALQSKLWSRVTKNITSRFDRDSSKRAIVVLIHGFNVNSPQRDYRIAQARIREVDAQDTDIVFVRVHWDGSKGPVKTKAWSKAQYTGPLVGFRMREFYNQLAERDFGSVDPSVHVLTHSSGAFLTTASFGNPISSLPRLGETEEGLDFYDDFKNFKNASTGKWAIPEIDNLHIGMLAAALPSDSFTGYVKTVPDGESENSLNYIATSSGGFYAENRGWLASDTSLIFSLNPKDLALSNLGIVSANSSIFGAKGVGAKKQTFCFLDDWVNRTKSSVNVEAFDFIRTENDKARGYSKRSHDFSIYLTQEASTDFLRRFLGIQDESELEISCN